MRNQSITTGEKNMERISTRNAIAEARTRTDIYAMGDGYVTTVLVPHGDRELWHETHIRDWYQARRDHRNDVIREALTIITGADDAASRYEIDRVMNRIDGEPGSARDLVTEARSELGRILCDALGDA